MSSGNCEIDEPTNGDMDIINTIISLVNLPSMYDIYISAGCGADIDTILQGLERKPSLGIIYQYKPTQNDLNKLYSGIKSCSDRITDIGVVFDEIDKNNINILCDIIEYPTVTFLKIQKRLNLSDSIDENNIAIAINNRNRTNTKIKIIGVI
jgi:hypothetical protein